MHSSSISPRRVALALAAAVPLLIGALAVPQASAASGIGWEVTTVDGKHGTDRANYEYSVDPGAVVDDSIRISNTGDEAVTVALYPADGFTTRAGEFDLRTRDAEPKAVGAWLTLDAEQITVQPGETADVPFRITVPDGARGEFIGGIVTTDAAPEGADAEQRTAVRVRLHVGASFRPQLAVEDVQVDYASTLFRPGRATVTYTVRNTGDTVISSEQSIAVAGPLGIAPRRADDYQATPQLLPGETWTLSADIDGVLPLAALTATVSAVPLYVDAAGSTGPLRAVDQAGTGWAVPWAALAVIVLLGLLLTMLVWLRRRRGRAAAPAPTGAPTAE